MAINIQLAMDLNHVTGAFLKIYRPNHAPKSEPGTINDVRRKVSVST